MLLPSPIVSAATFASTFSFGQLVTVPAAGIMAAVVVLGLPLLQLAASFQLLFTLPFQVVWDLTKMLENTSTVVMKNLSLMVE